MSAVISKYEQRIQELETEKLLLQEKAVSTPQKQGSFDELFKLFMMFIHNPQKLWRYRRFEHKRTVIKLAFDDRMVYS